ncbi:MAG: ATP-binding protein, partial [Gemmatimonadota bacterium]
VDYRSIFSVFWPGTEDPFPEERLPMMRALQGEATTMSDLEVRVRDRLLEVGVSAAPVRDADNRVVYSIATFTDISARRSVERMKDEFLSMVSHELRTPLTSIRGALGLLSSGKLGELSGKGLRMVEIAVNDTDRLVRLINDILDIERMESGRISLERSQVAADQLVQRAVEAIMPLAERAGVKLTTATQPVTVWADPDRILQTLTNLLGNAIKFTPAGAGVQVTVEVNGSEAVFSVHDQGRGIPGDKLQSIFERFQQVDASDARQKGGAGLGLAISRSIVLQHSGHIWAESDGKTGSTFRFTLPVLHADAVTIDLPARAPVVLLGEASATAREVLQSILQENGYSVLIADTGLQVLELAKSMGPSVILLDLQKPDLETSRWLHEDEATRNIPVVDLSELSSAESADRPSSGEPGKPLDPGSASGWLSRPVDPGALIESVDRALSSNGKMQRVLIIEDDVPLANVLRELFEARNLHPMVAFNTEDAVRALEKVTPNVIVLDLGDRTGFELVDMLRGKEHTRSIPLVVYTSSELDAGARGRLRLGPGEFLQKSRVHPEEVAHRVALLLHRVTGES